MVEKHNKEPLDMFLLLKRSVEILLVMLSTGPSNSVDVSLRVPSVTTTTAGTVTSTSVTTTSWWFGTCGLFFHTLGMSSSQLTNFIIFLRGRYTTNQILTSPSKDNKRFMEHMDHMDHHHHNQRLKPPTRLKLPLSTRTCYFIWLRTAAILPCDVLRCRTR